ncbi:hypothetical protein E2C01_007617 [Portunus trituberculatus]|uniref:Uncharacterized protein n=1 Tax=Portunus trituberculatus TaxID=210409 RepID=A0A5B7D0X6_PORTR|nr:hypothetical protein [Portunus trituberculatus]
MPSEPWAGRSLQAALRRGEYHAQLIAGQRGTALERLFEPADKESSVPRALGAATDGVAPVTRLRDRSEASLSNGVYNAANS